MTGRISEWFRAIRQYAWAAGIAVVVALLVRGFVMEGFRVPTSTMRPTLFPGDLIFVQKILRAGVMPRHGDVVVYETPRSGGMSFIKRVVGLPGDRVSVRGGRLVLNGEKLPFAQGLNAVCGVEQHPRGEYPICLIPPLSEDLSEVEVTDGKVFVLGDFRNEEASLISGELISIEKIQGRALGVWISLDPETRRVRWERVFTRLSLPSPKADNKDQQKK